MSPNAHAENDVAQYLYCIVRCREPRNFDTLGMGERGDAVHTINFKDLAVVASDLPEPRYDNTRRNMMAHMRVLDEVMADHTVLPIRFDSVAPGPDAVREQLLKARYGELSALLDGMEGRIEMGLKAFWYEDVVFQEIVQDNPTIRRLRESLGVRSLEETYYERIRLGELVEAELKSRRVRDADSVLERLRPFAEKTKVNVHHRGPHGRQRGVPDRAERARPNSTQRYARSMRKWGAGCSSNASAPSLPTTSSTSACGGRADALAGRRRRRRKTCEVK